MENRTIEQLLSIRGYKHRRQTSRPDSLRHNIFNLFGVKVACLSAHTAVAWMEAGCPRQTPAQKGED